LARHPADDSENDNASVDAAALLAEVEALRQRLAALEERLPRSAVADPPERRQAMQPALPQNRTETAQLEPDAAGRIARRRALGLGALASLFAFIGRGTARAADALTIESDGATIAAKKINFGTRFGALLALWEPGYEFGIQPGTLYARSGKNFAWYKGGTYLQEELKPGGDGTTMMSLSDGNLAVSGNVTAGGQFVGKETTTLEKGLTVAGDATLQKSLIVTGNQAVQETAGKNTVDVQVAPRTKLEVPASGGVPAWAGDHPTGLALYVSASSGPAGAGVEFRHSNGTQGIGFGYNTIYATGTHPNQPLILKARGTGTVQIAGTLQANAVIDENPLRNRMYPADPVVYQEIFDALTAGAIQKIGNPAYNDTAYKGQSLWNDRHIISFGGNNEADGNGAVVTIPAGYDTVWVRVLGERWNVIHAYFLDNSSDLGLWTGGYRSANSYAPDGTLADGYAASHQWLPLPARGAGRLALISKPNTDKEFWISGLAFSKNPWAHAVQSAVGYHWAVNGGNATGWEKDGHNWNSDLLAKIDPRTKWVLRVPVAPSGRDKLLYLIEHNSNWNGTMHTAITVEGQPVERFMATYDNPFSRHWNSKLYERYIAARIPNQVIPANARYLNVVIDMTKQDSQINFREIGTHDLAVPWP